MTEQEMMTENAYLELVQEVEQRGFVSSDLTKRIVGGHLGLKRVRRQRIEPLLQRGVDEGVWSWKGANHTFGKHPRNPYDITKVEGTTSFVVASAEEAQQFSAEWLKQQGVVLPESTVAVMKAEFSPYVQTEGTAHIEGTQPPKDEGPEVDPETDEPASCPCGEPVEEVGASCSTECQTEHDAYLARLAEEVEAPVRELIDPGPSRKGWHRLQTALQCPRKYALYTASKTETRTTSSAPLIRGTLLHTALAHHYALKKDPTANLYSPVDAITAQVNKQPNPEEWAEHATLVTQTYLQYELRWTAEQWEVVEVERELAATIEDKERREAYLYTQRADLIVRNPATGLLYIVDHKTTSRLTAKTLRRYTLSGQFRGYVFFGRGFLGNQFGGVILNMIQWPRGDGEATFQRSDLEPAPHADKTFKDTVIYAERLIRDLTPRHNDPMAWPGVHHETGCWTPYGPCEYHTRCEWGTE